MVQRARKSRVATALGEQRMCEPSISAVSVFGRTASQSASTSGGKIHADRPDVDETDAARRTTRQRVRHVVGADAAGADLRIARQHAAEGDEQFDMFGDVGERRLQRVERTDAVADHMRQDHLGRRETIGVDGRRVAAEPVQKPMQLALRMWEAPGATPTVGAGVDRGIAMGVADALELARHEIERLLPGHGDERLAAPALAGPGAIVALEPAGAHMRLRHPARRIEAGDERRPDRRRMRIVRRCAQAESGAGAVHLVGAPMEARVAGGG